MIFASVGLVGLCAFHWKAYPDMAWLPRVVCWLGLAASTLMAVAIGSL